MYTSDKAPPASEPLYQHLSEARHMKDIDAFVCVREWIPLLSKIPAKIKLFWTGDGPEQVQNFGIGDKRIASLIDGFLAVSDWQAKAMVHASGFPEAKMHVIRNGVHLPFFDRDIQRIDKHLIYYSTPFRGLALLPRIFRDVKKTHPDAILSVFSGVAVYQTDSASEYLQQVDAQFRPTFEELEAIDGVTVYGNVLQKELAEAMLSADVLCYPNTFAETSCITIMEAQAAGCVPLTSALAALPETVGDAGVLISEQPGTEEYVQRFTAELNSLLSDNTRRDKLREQARSRAFHEHSWQNVAERLERQLAEKFNII